MAFQQARGLGADGIVGPQTWGALLSAGTSSRAPAVTAKPPLSAPSSGGDTANTTSFSDEAPTGTGGLFEDFAAALAATGDPCERTSVGPSSRGDATIFPSDGDSLDTEDREILDVEALGLVSVLGRSLRPRLARAPGATTPALGGGAVCRP